MKQKSGQNFYNPLSLHVSPFGTQKADMYIANSQCRSNLSFACTDLVCFLFNTCITVMRFLILSHTLQNLAKEKALQNETSTRRHHIAGQNHTVKIGNKSFRTVAKIKYFRMVVTNHNYNDEEIISRLISRNTCYNSVRHLSSSRIKSENVNIKIKLN
jgi:hypothetical protein